MSFMLSALTVGGIGIILIIILLGSPIAILYAIYRYSEDGAFNDWFKTTYVIQEGDYNVPDWVLKLRWNFDITYELPFGEDTHPKWQRMLKTNPAKAYASLVTERKQRQSITRCYSYDLSLIEVIHYIYGVPNTYTSHLVLPSKYYYIGDLLLYQNAEDAAQMEILQALPNDYEDKKRILIETLYQQVFPRYSELSNEVIGEEADLRVLIETILEHNYVRKQDGKTEWLLEKYNHPFPERDSNFTIQTKGVHFKHTKGHRFKWKAILLLLFFIGLFIFSICVCGMLLESFVQQ
ncbi:MAG: hypothetical protein NC131_16010 [Roseburia sp.]|nr:hypothetical protein [Roseburia sp.]